MSQRFPPYLRQAPDPVVVARIGGAILRDEDDTAVGAHMLDTFIIDRIRRREEEARDSRIPLTIEAPRDGAEPPRDRRDEREDADRERGIAIIDFSI
jgi:hypothetical protein